MVILDGQCGLIDTTGKEICEIKYDYLRYHAVSGFIEARQNDKWAIIDLDGNEICPSQYDAVSFNPTGGYIGVCNNDKWGKIDDTGKIVIPIEYDNIYDFEGGYALLQYVDGESCVEVVKHE